MRTQSTFLIGRPALARPRPRPETPAQEKRQHIESAHCPSGFSDANHLVDKPENVF